MRGLIDCRQARTLDRDWWLGVGWALRWLHRQLNVEVAELQYRLNLAVLDYAGDPKVFDQHWGAAQGLQSYIRQHKLPWLKIKAGVSPKDVAALSKQWKAIFGDPADPEVARRIEETAKALLARAAGRPENGHGKRR
jgi:hypothetical protein